MTPSIIEIIDDATTHFSLISTTEFYTRPQFEKDSLKISGMIY